MRRPPPDEPAAPGRREILLAGLRRIAVLLLACVAVTLVASVVLGALFGASLDRSVSVGFYLAGSVLVILGFFTGNRGPVRLGREGGTPVAGMPLLRWDSPDERRENVGFSAGIVFVGFCLILLGVLTDSRYPLV